MKLGYGTQTDVLHGEFPRLNGRGLIEARPSDILLPSGGLFPRLNGRGLIEARPIDILLPSGGLFPRLNGRGLIEAFPTVSVCCRNVPRFPA